MEFPSSGVTPLTVEAFDTTRHLAHAAKQARERGFDKITLVDADTHHDETGSFREMVGYIHSTVERHLARAGTNEGRRPLIPRVISYDDNGGWLRGLAPRNGGEATDNGDRDIKLTPS